MTLNFWLKGLFRANVYGPLDGGMVRPILQHCRWKFSHKETLQQTLIDLNLFLNKKSLFEPPFGGLRGNVCTPSIARWEAHGRLPNSHN